MGTVSVTIEEPKGLKQLLGAAPHRTLRETLRREKRAGPVCYIMWAYAGMVLIRAEYDAQTNTWTVTAGPPTRNILKIKA